MNAIKILNSSTLLVKEDCMIISGMVYERVSSNVYRVFFSEDDYDYIEDDGAVRHLNKLFNARHN